MRAAVMLDGERPVYGSFAEPQATDGLLVVTMCAAALSGLDTRVARRLHYFKMPDGPFVIGKDGVARGSDGRRIYFNANAPVVPFGSMAERTLIDPRFAFPVPDNVADDVAAAMGNAGLAAWLPLSWRAKLRPGETVLILGATGISGLIAVTAARRLGAGPDRRCRPQPRGAAARRAAGRRRNRRSRGDDGPRRGLSRSRRRRGRPGHRLCVRSAAEAALEVLAHHGRLVHIGALAGPAIKVSGATLRRTCCDILGFAYYHPPIEVQAQAYAELCRLAAAGEIALDIETRPLAEIGAAWDTQTARTRRRQVLIP